MPSPDGGSPDGGLPDVGTSYMTLEIGDDEVVVPHEIAEYERTDGCVVVLFDTHASAHESEPIIEERDRNVAGYGYDGERRWTVEEPPHDFPIAAYERLTEDMDGIEYAAGSYFRYLMRFDDALYARHTNQYRYELDPATGELVDAAPDNTLPIGGRTRTFWGPVHRVVRRDGKTAVLLHAWAEREHLSHEPDEDLDTDDYLYCFDADGDLLWTRSTAYLEMSYGEDRGLELHRDHRIGTPDNVDLGTG